MMNKKPRSYTRNHDENRRGKREAYVPSAPRGYKSDLNKMFDTGKVPDRFKSLMQDTTAAGKGAERQKFIRVAREADTPQAFEEALSALVAQYELPDDQDILVRGLDHSDEQVVVKVLDALIDMDGRRPLTKRTVLKMRLDTLEQVATDSSLLNMVDMLRARL